MWHCFLGMHENKKIIYLIFGTVKSEGSLEIFTICGLLGNFSKIRRRSGNFSFVSAFASLCFSYKKKSKRINPHIEALFIVNRRWQQSYTNYDCVSQETDHRVYHLYSISSLYKQKTLFKTVDILNKLICCLCPV